MSYHPLLIANKIIEYKHGEKITIMELLKLQYIAHGYTLATLNEPLFDSPIEAWPYGPVIKDVYNAFRISGVKIKAPIALPDNIHNHVKKEHEFIIKTVIELYKDKDGWELSALTHEPNSPWTNTVSTKGFYNEIPNITIQKYYQTLISRGEKNASHT